MTVARRVAALREAVDRSGARGFWRKSLDLELQKTTRSSEWDNLRGDPRFGDLLRRIGLPA